METDKNKISALAREVLSLARDELLVHLRFLDMALASLTWQEAYETGGVATDGTICYYDPVFLLKKYKEEPKWVARCYLHTLLHCVFAHGFQYDKLESADWDLAIDIAVENVIIEMKLPGVTLKTDEEAWDKLRVLKEDAGKLTAERLYRYFIHNPMTNVRREELQTFFVKDLHHRFRAMEKLQISLEQWKKITERVKADLKSFTKSRPGSKVLEENLEETTREKYDYGAILQKFAVRGEDITVNDEEFDYIYYNYGLEHYGNLPLIEPLEYKESNKVREFVIALDTSASCRGEIVRQFLRKTYSLLKSSENFFHKVNIHIIQCDNQVQNDTKVTNDEDFEKFMKYGKLNGFGATDFRPVFEHVEELKGRGEFENLKGLIYFTDGYGIYPERMPDYDVIFAFLEEDENRGEVPPWSLKVILEPEELENEH